MTLPIRPSFDDLHTYTYISGFTTTWSKSYRASCYRHVGIMKKPVIDSFLRFHVSNILRFFNIRLRNASSHFKLIVEFGHLNSARRSADSISFPIFQHSESDNSDNSIVKNDKKQIIQLEINQSFPTLDSRSFVAIHRNLDGSIERETDRLQYSQPPEFTPSLRIGMLLFPAMSKSPLIAESQGIPVTIH